MLVILFNNHALEHPFCDVFLVSRPNEALGWLDGYILSVLQLNLAQVWIVILSFIFVDCILVADQILLIW